MGDAIQRLAIVGASVRAAAASACRAGCEVIAADRFADADLQRIAAVAPIADYPAGLASWLAATDCDAWMYTGPLENRPELIAQLAALRRLAGNLGEPLRRARDPFALQTALADAGLDFPETRTSADGLPQDGSWLCKTYRGASGVGVWSLDGPAAAERCERERAVCQRRVTGVPASAVFVCDCRGGDSGVAPLLGVTRQLVGDASLGARPWAYAGSVGPWAVEPPVRGQLERLGTLLAERFQLRGLVGADLVLDGGRCWVVEINPRYSASVEVVEQATGVSAVAAHLATCAGQPWTPPPPPLAPDRWFGKAVLYAKRTVAVTSDFFTWAIEQIEGDPRRLADVPHAGATIEAGHPVLTLLVAAPPTRYDSDMSAWIAAVESRLYAAN